MGESINCVLALDQATSCGWCVWKRGEPLVSGVWNLASNTRFESEGMRLIHFRSKLNQLGEAYQFDLVVFEEIRFARYVDAHAIHNQLVGILKAWCLDKKIPYTAIPVGTVKRFATGSGNANKDQMLAAAGLTWPLQPCGCDNEADARFILGAGMATLGECPYIPVYPPKPVCKPKAVKAPRKKLLGAS